MKLYLLFLIAAVAVGAAPIGRPVLRRPSTMLVGCLAVATLFYSYRFVR